MKHLALAILIAASPVEAQRRVAITIDDLPTQSTQNSFAVKQQITTGLLTTLHANHVPAIGFVNEGKLYDNGVLDSARVALLDQWLVAGMQLGNHSYSHRDLQRTPVAEFERDVLRGEVVTHGLMKKRGQKLGFFRHPFLHTGPSLAVRREFELFLTKHNYRVAPVTIDNNDYIFAHAYDVALDRGDSVRVRQVGAQYVDYMTRIFAYYEQQSKVLLGYELPQTLLLHASRLNAAYLDELLTMMRRRGYTFVSLDTALSDPAYKRADGYAGPSGITWLHRWALTEGRKGSFFAGEPQVPDGIH